MDNTQYTETMIGSAERIYIDTATLMENSVEQFIMKNADLFLASGKKLIVPKSVCSELARHLGPGNETKSALAMKAVALISQHQKIFEVENTLITEEEIAAAFADAQLLAELTLHKPDCNQLLITNDKRLSRDAYGLNLQQSCKGRRIFVCYVNKSGELNCCECVREAIAQEHSAIQDLPSVTPIPEPPVYNAAEPSKKGWQFDWKSGSLGVLFGLAVELAFKNRKIILSLL